MKMKLNVYPMIADMEERLKEMIQEAADNRAKVLEIAYGPASESIKKRILNFLIKKDIRKLYSRFEKTEKGWSRIYVYFRR